MPQKDLWINFVTDTSINSKYYWNVKGGDENGWNKGWAFYYKGMGTTSVDGESGEADGYSDPEGGLTDFYPATGYRTAAGGYSNSSTEGRYTCSAGSGTQGGLFIFSATSVSTLSSTSYLGNGCLVRCVKEN